jgi:hypothetical protein
MSLLRIAACAAFALSLVLYGMGAAHSPLMSSPAAERMMMLKAVAKGAEIDLAAEEALARAYWARNPDVAANGMYGEGGRMGVLGAREHYLRHGRFENRPWGP